MLTGQVLLRLRRLEDAETRLRRTLKEAEQHQDRYRQMLVLNNLGMRFVNQRRFDEALPWFSRVLMFDDLEATTVYAVSLTNAGLCYARLGDFERALDVQHRAVALQERRGAAGPHEQALGELGSTYLLMEDVHRGIPHLKRALGVAEQAGLTADAALWARNLAAAHVHVEQWDEAERYNEQGRRLAPPEARTNVSFSTLHTADIAMGRGEHAEAQRLFRLVLAEPAVEPALRWAAHDGLGVIARRQGNSRDAVAQLNEALGTLERTRADLLRTDDRLSFTTRVARFYRTFVDFLVERATATVR